MSKNKVALLAGGSIIVAFLFLIGGIFLVTRISKNNNLSAEEKQRIFEEIINNNPSNVLTANTRGSQSRESAPSADMVSSAMPLIYSPQTREYKYRYSKTTYLKGTAADKCSSLNYDEFLSSSESYEYYSNNNESYYKYIQYDSANNVYGYNLNNYTSASNESIEYRGGSYAVRSSYLARNTGLVYDEKLINPEEEGISFPTETPMDEEKVDYKSLIEQYFGPDADIIDVVSENGRKYYVVQYSFQTDCSGNLIAYSSLDIYNPTTLPDKIFVLNYVNSENFEIQRTYNYYNEVRSNNLVNSNTHEFITTNDEFSSVSDKFKFEYSVPVKDIVYPEYNAENEAIKLGDFLSTKNINLIVPKSWTIQSIYSNEYSIKESQPYNYYSDRNFYPLGVNGDKMFELNIKSYGFNQDTSLLSLYFYLNQDIGTYLNVEIFDKTAELVSQEDYLVNSKDVNINLNGENISAKQNTYEIGSFPHTYRDDEVSSSAPDTRMSPQKYTRREVIFDYNDYKYRITLPETEDFGLFNIDFEVLNTKNSTQMSSIRGLIQEVLIISQAVDGSGQSGRNPTTESSPPSETSR